MITPAGPLGNVQGGRIRRPILPFGIYSSTFIFLMSIRLLALDLDGTLLNSRGQISGRNRHALDKAREGGVKVAIVTGRRFRDARPIALDLGLDVPVIAHNGALTKHAHTLETVAFNLLPLDATFDALRIGRSHGADPLISDDHKGLGVLIYDHLSGSNKALLEYVAWAKRIHGDEGQEAVKKVESLEAYLDHPPVHLAFSGGCASMNTLTGELQSELGDRVKIFCTSYPQKDFSLIDIVHPAASKGAGVAAAAEELGISAMEVMAVGDNLNDLEMLEFAGTAVIMENAEPMLRKLPGFHVTATNDADGVALAIDRFILVSENDYENLI